MIKVENIEVFNFEGALRGMRMPYMSHSKSDSGECDELQCLKCVYGQDEEDDCTAPDGFDYKYSIGKADMELCKKLIKGGEKIEVNRFFKEGNSDENPWEEISREEYEDRKNSIIKRKKMNMSAN